jgi:SpoVK/Ycf46/Vps4 family AAA+-type ATPase
VDSESRLALADEMWIGPAEVDIVLEPAIAERVQEFVRFVRASDKLMASHVGISPSMIITGPPGVGKTELARYIAAQLGLPLIVARSDALISSFLGSTAKNIRALFEHVKSRPCILFLDELDSVAKLRDDQHEMGELKRVVVSLLQNIDALDNETVLLAATNHHHLLDPAVWRRFAYRIELGLPSASARQRLIELFLGERRPKNDAKALASLSEGLSGADLRTVCENAIRLAVVNGQSKASPAEIMRGVVRARLGEGFPFESKTRAHLEQVRALGPAMFTMKRLAALFRTSESTVCRHLNSTRETRNGTGRDASAHQGGHPSRG